jgi:hypothetical protein
MSNKIFILKELVKLANHLDSKGLHKEADQVDSRILKFADGFLKIAEAEIINPATAKYEYITKPVTEPAPGPGEAPTAGQAEATYSQIKTMYDAADNKDASGNIIKMYYLRLIPAQSATDDQKKWTKITEHPAGSTQAADYGKLGAGDFVTFTFADDPQWAYSYYPAGGKFKSTAGGQETDVPLDSFVVSTGRGVGTIYGNGTPVYNRLKARILGGSGFEQDTTKDTTRIRTTGTYGSDNRQIDLLARSAPPPPRPGETTDTPPPPPPPPPPPTQDGYVDLNKITDIRQLKALKAEAETQFRALRRSGAEDDKITEMQQNITRIQARIDYARKLPKRDRRNFTYPPQTAAAGAAPAAPPPAPAPAAPPPAPPAAQPAATPPPSPALDGFRRGMISR